jgi:hypothetical protein
VIRRSFRIGLWLGLLAGVGAAVMKLLRSREAPSPAIFDLGATPSRSAPAPAVHHPPTAATDLRGIEDYVRSGFDRSPADAPAAAPAPAWTPLEAPISTPDPVEVPEPAREALAPAPEAPPPDEEPGLVVVGDAPLQPAEDVVASNEPLDGEPTTAEDGPEAPAPPPAAKAPAARRTPARTAPPPKKAAAKAPVAKKAALPRKFAAPPKAAAPKKAAPKKAAPKKLLAPWVNPDGLICPPTHPIKAKLSSQLFHLPGMFAYARTTPDRCYKSAEEALADGLRSAKR